MRLRSRFDSSGRSQSSPNRTSSVSWASLGAKSPRDLRAADGVSLVAMAQSVRTSTSRHQWLDAGGRGLDGRDRRGRLLSRWPDAFQGMSRLDDAGCLPRPVRMRVSDRGPRGAVEAQGPASYQYTCATGGSALHVQLARDGAVARRVQRGRALRLPSPSGRLEGTPSSRLFEDIRQRLDRPCKTTRTLRTRSLGYPRSTYSDFGLEGDGWTVTDLASGP
jgi:hypothetical protein